MLFTQTVSILSYVSARGRWWWCPKSKLEMSDDMLAGYYGSPPATTFPSVPIVKAEKHVNNAVICQ